MKKIVFFFLFSWINLWGQWIPFSTKVKSVYLFNPQRNNVLPILTDGEKLNLSFDEWAEFPNRFYYRFTHYTSQWEKSRAFPNEYMEGLLQVDIKEYKKSFHTQQNYYHYAFAFPNESVQFKLSGNYSVEVYDRKNNQQILSKRFLYYRSQVSIDAKVERGFVKLEPSQVVNVTVKSSLVNVLNSRYKIKVAVFKNYNLNSVQLKEYPTLRTYDALLYNNRAFEFTGGMGYFSFDTKNKNIATFYTRRINKNSEEHETHLFPSRIYAANFFQKIPDVNGGYYFRASSVLGELDSAYEGDYSAIHFTLVAPKLKGNVYVVGAFNEYQVTASSQLIYNKEKSAYQGVQNLKQGYYNYKFVKQGEDGEIKDVNPSFWQTENVYQVLVYGKAPEDRYESLIGYAEVSSVE